MNHQRLLKVTGKGNLTDYNKRYVNILKMMMMSGSERDEWEPGDDAL